LIRRAVNCARKLGVSGLELTKVAKSFIDYYKEDFENLKQNETFILTELTNEVEKFEKAVESGIKEFNQITLEFKEGDTLDGKSAFRLFDTFGFPLDMTVDLCKERKILVDKEGFEKAMGEHQQESRDKSGVMFKGGVATSTNEADSIRLARLHSATHLMLSALKKVLGDYVEQRGSNITTERLRFDFLCDHKMTAEELQKVEQLVNESIESNVPIICEKMSPEEARNSGATGIFDNKYGDVVTVYTMGEFSKEICGGPHAKTTGELKKFKILKEESSSNGIRRIKATIFDE